MDYNLDGLLEEYNPFVMQMYENSESLILYNFEAFHYVKETHLDKFQQD